ncbi:MAG: VPLPA-CTERM sorting domain-containing protein [Pseudomonadota bacterium]
MTIIRSTAAAAALMLAAGSAQALTVDVLFDDSADETVTAPFVGSATLVLDGVLELQSEASARSEADIPDGIYLLAEFFTFEFDASFDNPDPLGPDLTFDEGDLVSPPFDVLVELRTTPDGRTFGFETLSFFEDEVGDGDLGTNFVNEEGFVLSFQPGFGPLYFVEEFFVEQFGAQQRGARATPLTPVELFGSFGPETQTSDVPVPAALPLMALGIAALGAAARRRKA